jgi:hypothetical protein
MAGAGFGGAALYNNSDAVVATATDALRRLFAAGATVPRGGVGVSGGDVTKLADQLNSLASRVDVALLTSRHGGGTVVVRDYPSGGGGARAVVILVAAGAVYAKVRGVGLADLRPVSARALAAATAAVKDHVEAVRDSVRRVRDELDRSVRDVNFTSTSLQRVLDTTVRRGLENLSMRDSRVQNMGP